VFQCEVDDCGRFYHPKCVAELLYPDNELEGSLFGDQVAARQNFTCPIHECIVCKGEENKNDKNMQFAVCRSCPTTYHRGCLPRFSSVLLSLSCYVLLIKTWVSFADSLYIFGSDIPFETKEGPNGYMQRAWDELEAPDGRVIPRDRILIYCTCVNLCTLLLVGCCPQLTLQIYCIC